MPVAKPTEFGQRAGELARQGSSQWPRSRSSLIETATVFPILPISRVWFGYAGSKIGPFHHRKIRGTCHG